MYGIITVLYSYWLDNVTYSVDFAQSSFLPAAVLIFCFSILTTSPSFFCLHSSLFPASSSLLWRFIQYACCIQYQFIQINVCFSSSYTTFIYAQDVFCTIIWSHLNFSFLKFFLKILHHFPLTFKLAFCSDQFPLISVHFPQLLGF